MENKIEEIMKEYKDGVESIDKKYDVKEVRKPKMLDTQELDNKIKYEKEFIAKLEYEGQDTNKDMIEKAKARLELAEAEKKEIEENNDQKLDRYNKSVEKREEKVLENEKMKHSMVVLPSGREVTMAEKDKMDKQELKDKAIRGLTQESKAVSEELLKKDKELKAINQELIDVDYDIRISTERDDDKIAKRDELNQKLLELREEMKGLSKVQEKCNTYLEELKAPTKEEKAFMETWKDAYKKEQEDENQQGQSQQNQGQQGQGQQGQGQQGQGQQGQKSDDSLYKITIGKKAKISMGEHEFSVGSKEVKKGINLSDKQIAEILDEYIDKEEEKTLAKQLIKNNEMDTTILNVIYKAGIDSAAKKDLVNCYLNKCLVPNEEKNIGIEYDANKLSKVNILNRILKIEINNNEKNELILRAKKAAEKGITSIKGEYKINWAEKIFGAFGGTLRLPEVTEAQIEAANKYNDSLHGKQGNEFKESMKVAKENMSKEGYKELKSLAKSQNKQIAKIEEQQERTTEKSDEQEVE